MFSWFSLLASFSQSLKSAHPTGQAKSDKSFFACLFVLLHLIILQKSTVVVPWYSDGIKLNVIAVFIQHCTPASAMNTQYCYNGNLYMTLFIFFTSFILERLSIHK